MEVGSDGEAEAYECQEGSNRVDDEDRGEGMPSRRIEGPVGIGAAFFYYICSALALQNARCTVL